VKLISVSGKYAKADNELFHFLSRFKWVLHSEGYARTTFKGKFVYMHEFVCLPTPGQVIDHLNFDRLDNRKVNLKLTTNIENLLRNKNRMRKDLGVSKFHINGKWRARITRNGKEIHLGLFDSKVKAIEARNNWMRRNG